MRKQSSITAGATYLDKKKRIEQLRQAASRAHRQLPSIRRVILFGSLASGIPTPRSDADILVVVDSTTHALHRDRVPPVLEALSPLPCPIDVFVVTCEELEQPDSPLIRVALSTGMDLLSET